VAVEEDEIATASTSGSCLVVTFHQNGVMKRRKWSRSGTGPVRSISPRQSRKKTEGVVGPSRVGGFPGRRRPDFAAAAIGENVVSESEHQQYMLYPGPQSTPATVVARELRRMRKAVGLWSLMSIQAPRKRGLDLPPPEHARRNSPTSASALAHQANYGLTSASVFRVIMPMRVLFPTPEPPKIPTHFVLGATVRRGVEDAECPFPAECEWRHASRGAPAHFAHQAVKCGLSNGCSLAINGFVPGAVWSTRPMSAGPHLDLRSLAQGPENPGPPKPDSIGAVNRH